MRCWERQLRCAAAACHGASAYRAERVCVVAGTTEGPWNHTKRLESILGARLRVVGLIDINAKAAQARIDTKLASPAAASWKDCKVFSSVKEAAAALSGVDSPLYGSPHIRDRKYLTTSPSSCNWTTNRPHPPLSSVYLSLTLVGLPPFGRGSSVTGKDVDLQARIHFPQTAIFVEKPISWTDAFKDVHGVADQMQGATVSVGYMLRYLKAVQEMKRILKENNLNVMATMTTYFMA